MVFESLLNPIFSPLLALDPLYTILVLSFGITFLITLVYKFATDQEEMKRLKDKMKDFQKRVKELQKESPEKAMDVQKEAMETNMKYMKHSFKPTLYTFIPIIIIFAWMNAHLAYVPIQPSQPFNVSIQMEEGLPGNVTLTAVPELNIEDPVKEADDKVNWIASAETAGDYNLIVKYGEREFAKPVLISDTDYASPSKSMDGPVKQIKIGMKEVKPLGGFSIFGWHPGWLGTYIIFSIIFSISLRKILKLS